MGRVRALDASTGKTMWEFKLPSPPWAGVLSTAGGLVFGGSNEGNVFALDARTGQALWQFQTGGAVRSQSHVVRGGRPSARRNRGGPGVCRVCPGSMRRAGTRQADPLPPEL